MRGITSPLHDTTTALEVVEGIDLSGRRAIDTGGSSGFAVGDTAAGDRVAADVAGTSGRDDVGVAHLDLADLRTVDAFVAAWTGPRQIRATTRG